MSKIKTINKYEFFLLHLLLIKNHQLQTLKIAFQLFGKSFMLHSFSNTQRVLKYKNQITIQTIIE